MIIKKVHTPELFLIRNFNELHIENEVILSHDSSPVIIGPAGHEDVKEYGELYEKWEFYPIQYEWHTKETTLPMHTIIEASYDGVTESFRARQSRICYQLKNEAVWRTVHTTTDEVNKLLIGRVPTNTERIGFTYNMAWYSKFTQVLADEYPIWTHARNADHSNAQLFLNYFGITLEEVEAWIEWTHRQKYIMTADLKQIDFAYIYKVPEGIDLWKDVTISTLYTDVQLEEIESIHDFLKNSTFPGYFLDRDTNQLFTRVAYGLLDIQQGDEGDILEPQMHHVWNTFDEFGLLLGVERLLHEENESYRERILDVFRYPAGAHYLGLIYGIARETNQMTRVMWEDDTKPLYIKINNRHILTETIHLDHKPIATYGNIVHRYDNGDLEISPLNTGLSHIITFVSDLFLFQLYDKENDAVYPILFEDDGQATKKLKYWVNQINQVAPTMWGHTRWDIHYWDTIDEHGTGLGYIPNQYDTELDAWK